MTVEEGPQRTSPFWTFQALAAMHFIRCILFLLMMIEPILRQYSYQYSYSSFEISSILILIYIVFFVFVEMLLGFLLLTRKLGAPYVALFYVAYGILSPSYIRSFAFYILGIILLAIPPPLNLPTSTLIMLAISALHTIELSLLLLLGLNWVHKEWEREPSE